MTINQMNAKHIFIAALVLATLLFSQRTHAQALNMDGQSGIFLQPWAEVVPSPDHKFGGTTASFHMVDAGPVAGDYLNAGLEEGFGNWLEFGYTLSLIHIFHLSNFKRFYRSAYRISIDVPCEFWATQPTQRTPCRKRC